MDTFDLVYAILIGVFGTIAFGMIVYVCYRVLSKRQQEPERIVGGVLLPT
jgi:hypothetical protein